MLLVAIDEDELRRIRSEHRALLPHDGACYQVSDWVLRTYGYPMAVGQYLWYPNDDVPGPQHCWNVLPDGRILDGTADQFDLPDISIFEADDPRYEAWFEITDPDNWNTARKVRQE